MFSVESDKLLTGRVDVVFPLNKVDLSIYSSLYLSIYLSYNQPRQLPECTVQKLSPKILYLLLLLLFSKEVESVRFLLPPYLLT